MASRAIDLHGLRERRAGIGIREARGRHVEGLSRLLGGFDGGFDGGEGLRGVGGGWGSEGVLEWGGLVVVDMLVDGGEEGWEGGAFDGRGRLWNL